MIEKGYQINVNQTLTVINDAIENKGFHLLESVLDHMRFDPLCPKLDGWLRTLTKDELMKLFSMYISFRHRNEKNKSGILEDFIAEFELIMVSKFIDFDFRLKLTNIPESKTYIDFINEYEERIRILSLKECAAIVDDIERSLVSIILLKEDCIKLIQSEGAIDKWKYTRTDKYKEARDIILKYTKLAPVI